MIVVWFLDYKLRGAEYQFILDGKRYSTFEMSNPYRRIYNPQHTVVM